jgi:hypothetical protein
MRKQSSYIPLIALSSILGACAPLPPTRAEVDLAMEAIKTTPTCHGDQDCALKWEAAQLWVIKNAGYKIQTVTSVLIATHNPIRSYPRLAAQVTKEPLGGGRHKIVARLWCDNIMGCRPDPTAAVVDFNRTVASSQP